MPDPIVILQVIGGTVIAAFASSAIKSIHRKKEFAKNSYENQNSDRFITTDKINSISKNYGVYVNNIYDFRLLVSKIQTLTEYEFSKTLYDNSNSLDIILQTWDSFSPTSIHLKDTYDSQTSSRITESEIDSFIIDAEFDIHLKDSLNDKVEEIINKAYNKGYTNFIKRYVDQMNALKSISISSNNTELIISEIRSDLKRYLKFFN